MFRPRLASIYQTYLAWRVWPCGYHHISIWDIKFMLLNKFMTWKPDPCCWGFKMWTDEAICSESKRGWVTKLRTKTEPLSPMLLGQCPERSLLLSRDWKISELPSKCFQWELSKTQQMGFFTLWLMKAWHMARRIKFLLPAVQIYIKWCLFLQGLWISKTFFTHERQFLCAS